MFNNLNPDLRCEQSMLNVCPYQYSSPPINKAIGNYTTLNHFFGGSSLMT